MTNWSLVGVAAHLALFQIEIELIDVEKEGSEASADTGGYIISIDNIGEVTRNKLLPVTFPSGIDFGGTDIAVSALRKPTYKVFCASWVV